VMVTIYGYFTIGIKLEMPIEKNCPASMFLQLKTSPQEAFIH
jgi:hypothetical protein